MTFHMQQDCSRETPHTVQADGRRKYRRKAGRLCTCGEEPRMEGQAYGVKCRAAYNKRWRAKQKQAREAEKAELAQLRAQLSQQGHDNGQSDKA
jgi:hypothetical protein